MNLRSQILTAATAAMAGMVYSMPASASAASEAQEMLEGWEDETWDLCSLVDPWDFIGCIEFRKAEAMDYAREQSNNLNPMEYEQLIYFHFYYLVEEWDWTEYEPD